MTLPTNPELLKVRLKLNRAKQRREALKAQIREPLRQVDAEISVLTSELYRQWHQLGYCSNCEKTLDECRCVILGAEAEEPHWTSDSGGRMQGTGDMYIEVDHHEPCPILPPRKI